MTASDQPRRGPGGRGAVAAPAGASSALDGDPAHRFDRPYRMERSWTSIARALIEEANPTSPGEPVGDVYGPPMRPVRSSTRGLVALGALVVSGWPRAAGPAPPVRRAPQPPTPTAPTPTTGTRGPAGGPPIDWSQLRNPIVTSADHAVKDAALVAVGGNWVDRVQRGRRARHVADRDRALDRPAHWSPMTFMPHDPAVEGEASPDVVRRARRPVRDHVPVVRARRARRPGQALLPHHLRLRALLARAPAPPAAVHRSVRPPDRRRARVDAGRARCSGSRPANTDTTRRSRSRARRPASLDGPWQLVGKPDIRVFGDTIENYQFIRDRRPVEAARDLESARPAVPLRSRRQREPAGAAGCDGRPAASSSSRKRRGTPGRGITGSTYEHANCAYLVDRQTARRALLPRLRRRFRDVEFRRCRVTASSRIARSTDLVHWSVPPR